MEILGYALAVLVGTTLGLIGSGGAILAVPILVYIMGVEPLTATAYSLFIVGTTALVGSLQHAREKQVDFKTALLFGAPSIATVYATRAWLLPWIPEELFRAGDFVLTKGIALLLLFAVVMIIAAVAMIRPTKSPTREQTVLPAIPLMLAEGVLVGLITGLVGAGGGFLIIPALVLLARLPLKRAIGTSLLIIAANALIGFTGELGGPLSINWKLLLPFTGFALIGIFVGVLLSRRIQGAQLKTGFGWFILVMGVYILLKELVF